MAKQSTPPSQTGKGVPFDPEQAGELVPLGIGNPTTGFRVGFLAPLYGFQLFTWAVKKQGLLPLLLIPIAIQTFFAGLILLLIYLSFGYLQDFVDFLVLKVVDLVGSRELDGSEQSTIETINYFSHIGLWLLLIVIFFYLFFVVWRMTGGLLNGYLSGKLCDSVIAKLGWKVGNRQTTMLSEFATSALLATAFTSIQPLLGFAVFIPFVGPILSLSVSATVVAFLLGVNELRDPLRSMGLSNMQVLYLCFRYTPLTLGLGCSFCLTEPIPLLGGIVQTAESLGRIAVARRLMEQEGLLAVDESS